MDPHTSSVPSDWVTRFAHLIHFGGPVLDLAAGGGRHTRALLSLGHTVVAVDRAVAGMADLAGKTRLKLIEADLEAGPWPLADRRFAGIVVTNYLHRPLFPLLSGSLADGGVLIYETFAVGNEVFGLPRNPDFLLKPNELIEAFAPTLTVVAYEHGLVDRPKRAVVQRIVARAGESPVDLERTGP